MTVARWGMALIILVLAGYCILFNAVVAFRSAVLRRRRISLVPLVGGLSGAAGLWLVPVKGSLYWLWSPVVVDIGCLPLVLAAVLDGIRGRQSRPERDN